MRAAVGHREFADPFLMRDVAARIEPGEHRPQPGLHRGGLQHGHQHAHRHQCVAPEIGLEPPRTGQELLAIAEEAQRIARRQIVGRTRGQQLARGQPGQRLFAGGGGDAQADAPVRAGHDRGAVDTAAQYLQPQVIARRTVQPAAIGGHRVAADRRGRLHLVRQAADRLIVAQEADRRQHRLEQLQPRRVDAGHGHHAMQLAAGRAVRLGDGQRAGGLFQPPRRGAVEPREPLARAAVASREGDQDARVDAVAQQQVRGDRPLAHEGVDVLPLGQLIGQVGCGCLALCRRHPCRRHQCCAQHHARHVLHRSLPSTNGGAATVAGHDAPRFSSTRPDQKRKVSDPP